MKFLVLLSLLSLMSCTSSQDAPIVPKFNVGDTILFKGKSSVFDEVNCQEEYGEVVKIEEGRYLLKYYNNFRELPIDAQNGYRKVNCPKTREIRVFIQ